MLVARPEAKLSNPTTDWPSPRRRSTSVDPMNPAAPVTSARIGPTLPRYECRDVRSPGDHDRRRIDRGGTRGARGAGVRRLLLLGRPDPGGAGGHAEPAVLALPVRRPRRPRDARRIPGRRSHHPAGAAGVVLAGPEPGGAAAAGIAGIASHPAPDPGLAAGAAGAADIRVVHPAGVAGVRRVGRRAEFAAEAGRVGLGVW